MCGMDGWGTFAFELEELKCEVTTLFVIAAPPSILRSCSCAIEMTMTCAGCWLFCFLPHTLVHRVCKMDITFAAFHLLQQFTPIHLTTTDRYEIRSTSSRSRQIYRRGELHHGELPHMYLLPCVSCIKLALAHTFTFARVHPA